MENLWHEMMMKIQSSACEEVHTKSWATGIFEFCGIHSYFYYWSNLIEIKLSNPLEQILSFLQNTFKWILIIWCFIWFESGDYEVRKTQVTGKSKMEKHLPISHFHLVWSVKRVNLLISVQTMVIHIFRLGNCLMG